MPQGVISLSDRKAPQRIHKLMVREVKEKQANFGELRRFKKKAIMTKGLPNIPSLTLSSDAGLTYVVIIKWGREYRLLYFDKTGEYLTSDLASPTTNTLDLYEEVMSRSKYISRYPPKVKVPTLAEREHAMDQTFKQIWNNFRRYFQIPKKYVKTRPLIRIVQDSENSETPENFNIDFGGGYTDEFIFIHENIPNKLYLYAYYAIRFLLPKVLRDDNDTLAEQLCQVIIYESRLTTDPDPKWLLNLKNLKKSLHVPLELEIFPALHLVAEYITQGWQEEYIGGMVNWFELDPNPLTPQALPDFFEFIYLKDRKHRHLLHLWCLLAVKYKKPIPKHYLDPTGVYPLDTLLLALFSYKLVEADSLFTTLDLPPPMHKLLTEAFNQQYSQVLGFKTASVLANGPSHEPIFFTNLSDCYISVLHLISDRLTLVEKEALEKIFPLKLEPFENDPDGLMVPFLGGTFTIKLEYVCYVNQTESRELFRGTTSISM